MHFEMSSAICFNLDQSKILSSGNGLSVQSHLITALRKKAFENGMVNGENAGNQHFLLFATMFSTLPKTK